jgi:hypothetical protein
MSSLYFGRRKPYNKYAILTYQQNLVEDNYPFLKCKIIKNVLVCEGWLQPDHCKERYKIKIEYVAGNEPKSTILYPLIEPSVKIHMYNDHSLCLHYPPDMKWNERIKIYEYTIPWISEWIIYYEIYLLNGGVWEGRESPAHISEADKNLNKDFG